MTEHNFFTKAYRSTGYEQRGFSLIELSIVLVVLGLLTGGILAGQSLIRAAELRSVTTEYQKYTLAVQAFRTEYSALPGDMKEAELYWGTSDAVDANCITTDAVGTRTCNGDGDGEIEIFTTRSNEAFRFWQHLANAGLIEGSYTGTAGSGGNVDVNLGENTPRSKLGDAGWSIRDIGTSSGSSIRFDGIYNDVVEFGLEDGSFSTYLPALSTEEAWNIDTKIDDGKPGSGSLWAMQWNDCTDAADESEAERIAAEYALSTTGLECSLVFMKGFGWH